MEAQSRGRRIRPALAVAVVAALGLAGCEVNRATGERTLGGAAIGAGAGAVTGLITGDFLGSTATGAAAGAAGGFIYDQLQKR
jgi:osmotically inducible lipoprotein OsmB